MIASPESFCRSLFIYAFPSEILQNFDSIEEIMLKIKRAWQHLNLWKFGLKDCLGSICQISIVRSRPRGSDMVGSLPRNVPSAQANGPPNDGPSLMRNWNLHDERNGRNDSSALVSSYDSALLECQNVAGENFIFGNWGSYGVIWIDDFRLIRILLATAHHPSPSVAVRYEFPWSGKPSTFNVFYSLPKNQINLEHGLDEEICRIMNDGITDPWPQFSDKVFKFISHSARYSKFLKMSLDCGNGIKSDLNNLVNSSRHWDWQFETHFDQSGDYFIRRQAFIQCLTPNESLIAFLTTFLESCSAFQDRLDAIELRTACHVASVLKNSELFSSLLEELDEAKLVTEGTGLLQAIIILGELYEGCRSFWDTLRGYTMYISPIRDFRVTEV